MDPSTLLPAHVAARRHVSFDPKQEEAYYRSHAGPAPRLPESNRLAQWIRGLRLPRPAGLRIVRTR